MAELEADPAYRAAQATKEGEVAEREKRYAEAEAPLVEALAEAGVEVTSVWDLEHLGRLLRGHPRRLRTGRADESRTLELDR